MLAKVIMLNHVRTHCQLVDLLTKVLGYKQFSEFISKMRLINIYSPLVHLEGECQRPDGETSSAVGALATTPMQRPDGETSSAVGALAATPMQLRLQHSATNSAPR